MSNTPEKPFGEVEASLEKTGRVDELIKLYESRSREVPKADEAAHLLCRAADLCREKLKNPVRAEELFRRALIYTPNAREALEGLRVIYEARNDAAALGDVLEHLALVQSGAAAAALYLRAGELYETKLQRRDRAVLCYQLASRAAPQERQAYQRARKLLLQEGRFAPGFESLERERAALGDRELVEEYVTFAESLINFPQEHSLATKALVRALAVDDRHPKAHAIQKELSKLEYVWRDKVKALKAQSLEERDRRLAARLSLQVARLYAFYEPTAVDKVKEAIDRCFALWPAMPDALELLEQVAAKAGDVRVALTVFSKLAGDTRDKQAKVDLHLRIGQVLLSKLNDVAGACDAFDQAAKLDAARPDATELASEALISAGRLAEGMATLERHLATLKDKPAQVALRLNLADLTLKLLKDPAASRAHVEAAQKLDPNNAQVAFRLANLYADDGNLDGLWPLLELAASAPRPVTDRVALCELTGMLCEEAGDAKRAFHALSLALPLDPSKPALLASLSEAAEKAGLQAQLALSLRRAAQVAPPEAQANLWRTLGRLLQSLGRPAEAQEAWLEVQKRQLDDPEASQALAAMRKALSEEPQDPRSKLEAEARRLEASAADPASAAAVYRKILELDPDSVPTLKKLGAAAANLGLWDEVAVVAERLLALADSPAERQEWRSRLAQLYSERLNRREDAAKLYLNLLDEGNSSAAVVGGLERLAAQGVRQGDISRALAPVYAKAGDYQRQVASLLVQLSSVQDRDEQKNLLSLLAETTEKRLLDDRAAFDLRTRGLMLDPADTTFRAEAVRLGRALKAEQELARTFTELAVKTDAQTLAVSLLLEASELAEDVGAIDEAAASLRKGLERYADQPELLERLSELFLVGRRWGECDQVLRRRLALAQTAEERIALGLQLTQVNAELHRPREAAGALSEAIKAGAPEAEHLPRLMQLLEQGGQVRELTEAQARQVAMYEQAGEKEKASALALQRARLLETALGDKAEAIRRYAEVLATKPNDADALAALENLLADADHREAAARALLPAYEASKDHRKQVGALAVIADAAKDSLEKITALRRAADVHTVQLRQPEQAFASLASAMRLAPDDAEIRAAARAAAEDADALDSYAEVIEELIEGGAEQVAIALHRELAEVYEKKLNKQDEAIKHLRAVLLLDAKHLEALRALQRLHRAREEWNELVPITERLALLEADPAARSALDREAAVLAEQKLGDLERAAANWRLIAARDVLAREAATALDRLYAELDKPQELAFALELRRNQEGQSPQGRELAFRLAALRQNRLQDPRGALEVYRQILSEDASHEGTREALEAWARSADVDGAAAAEILDAVLARTGDHQRRIAIREARLAHAPSVTERARLAGEIRAILERDLAQPEAAFMNALKAFTDGLDRDGVQPELERLARVTGSFEELAEIYESTVEELPPTDEHVVPLLRRAAELREQLNEADEAARVWKQLLERVPQDRQALDSLSRLYESAKNARSLSEVYARKAELSQDPAERSGLLLKAAEAWESIGDEAQAIDALKTSFAINRSRDVLLSLERLFGKTKRSLEQADALAQLADTAGGDAERLELVVKRGLILEREGQHAEALRAFAIALSISKTEREVITALERLLTIDGARVEAARLLEGSYRELNDLKHLVEVLDVRLTVADPTRRVPLMLEIANLREAVGQKSLALTVRLRAFGEAPDDPEVREELERLAADLGAFEELTAAYEDALERGLKEPLAGELWRRLAVTYGDRLSRFDLAARAWNEVLARNPKDMFVLEQLGRIFRRTSQYRELSIVMRRQLGLETNVTVQVNLLFELANLAEEMLADKALAAQCYQAILERKPEEPNAIKLLGRILAETEKWPELAALLGREIQLAEASQKEEEALELLVRLGRLKLTRLGDPRGALATFQEVLRRKPAHAGAVGALEEMARSDNSLKGEAASTLEPVFANEGDHLKQVQMLEAKVAAEPQAAERAAILRRMAELYSTQLDNAEMAFVVSARALRELPDEPKNLELALLFFKKADAEDEMAALLAEVAPRASNDAARAELYRALARLQAQADEEQEAIESWKRVMELVPTDAEAMQQMGQLYSRQGRVNELLEVLKRQLTIEEENGKRASLLFQIGSLQEEQLRDPNAAIASFRRLLELSPDDAPALAKMERLCEAQQRWPELADVLARRIRLVTPEEQPPLVFKLAVVRETRLLDKQGALDLYRDLLAQNPRHEGALQRLEGLVQREPQNQVAFELLAGAFRRSSDVMKLAQLIEGRVAVSPDQVERKTLLVELAFLREAQGEPELAYLAYYRAFKEDPNDGQIRKSLIASGTAAASFDELVHALQTELPRIAEPVDVAEVCMAIAQLSEQRLGEKEQAVVFYEKARAAHPESTLKALPALDRLYGELEFPDKQADIIEVMASVATEPAEKVALSFRLGQLAMEQLDAPDRAAGAFENVLQADPKHLPSLRSLEILYEQAKASDKLYRVLEAQRDLVQGAERERLLGKMAVTSAEGLADVDHSIKLYRELLEKNPRNEQAFEALTRLLERGQKAEELRELLQWKLQFTVDPRELVRLNERLGRVLWQQLERAEDAVPFFKAALERDARHKGALEALRDIFDQLGKREDLVIVLRRLIPLQEDASGVKQIRIRLAEIISETARREEALDAARRALEVEPHQVPELDRLNTVFTRLKAWPDAVRTLDAKIAVQLQLEEREDAAKTAFQIADIWRGPANKLELAGQALERVLELEPSNRQAYEQALELFSRLNDWRSYAQVMDRYLPNLVTDEEKVATLRELARVQEQKLGAKHVAFLQYCRALQLNPAVDEVREQVERLADETGSYDELAAVYEEVAEAVPRGPLAERLYLTLSRVQDTRLDDPQAAETSLRHILEFDPTNETALERLAAMFARRGQNKEYVVSLEQKLEAAGSLERRKEILREIARVYDEQMQNPAEAETALIRALELEPDAETLGVLVALQRRQGNHAAVASTLMRMRDIAPTPEERSRIQVEVAQVYERDLQDDEAAVEGYRQALEFDPANGQALGALEQLYSKLDRPAELLAVYERQIELTSDYRERVKILFRSAAIWEERYQNLGHADACIEAALQVDPQNIQAIKTLERLRKSQGRWDELIGVVDRHIQLLTNPSEKAELCVEMGDIFHQQLKAVDRAATAYHQALELDARCRPAMHALGMLYERSGNWPFALDMLEREAQVLGQTPEAVELWYRMGKINEDMLIDAGSAKRCYLEALRIDAAYLPAIRALKGIYELERDFENYEKALLEEARQTEEPAARAQAWVQVGRYYESKENREQATAAYEEALKLEPSLLDAAQPLADIYLSTERYDRCEQMLDVVTAGLAQYYAASPDDPELGKELCRRHYRLGYVSEKNGKRDKALGAYERAYQLDATYLPVLEGYGNLLVHARRFEEALRVYQSILVHHRGDLTDLEVAEIYWTLGDLHLNLRQFDRAQNHFEKALAIDPAHEPSLRSMTGLMEQAQQFDRAVDFRQKLVEVLDGEQKFEAAVALGAVAKEKLSDPYIAIDAYLAAHRIRQDALDVMDALYVLYRETKQGAKAAEMLEKMLAVPALQQDAQRARRVWFALGELNRDELGDLEKAAACFNSALDAEWRFVEAFSALEQMLGRAKKWKQLDDNYKRMIARVPKTPDTHQVRMNLWKALGDLYLNALKAPEAAVQVYKVVAAGLPDNVEIQELYAGLAQTQPGFEQEAVDAWRRALPSTTNPGRVAGALAELAAKRKDYDSAWLAAQVSSGLIGEPGAGEKEILTKLGPYAKKREVAQRQLTDRLWTEHLFHPKVRGPLADLLAILFEQAGTLYKEDFTRYGIVPKKHFIDVATAQEYQIHHYRYVSRLLGMDQVAVFSPFLITTRERMAKRTTEPAPDPMIGVEICHTDPVALRFGGKFFSETGQREVYYLLGRTMTLLRPELALTQRLSGERLEAVLQAAISLSVDRFRFTADLRAIDTERKLLEKHLTPQARDALARVTREYVKVATPNDLRNFLEGAELSATRAGAFVAGEIEPVKRMVMAETGPNYRVQPRSKIRDLLVFALGDDLHALRVAVGTNVEVQLRK
ncbi:MAG: tetratricopeptide repeat protein [Myxococcota bacterium]